MFLEPFALLEARLELHKTRLPTIVLGALLIVSYSDSSFSSSLSSVFAVTFPFETWLESCLELFDEAVFYCFYILQHKLIIQHNSLILIYLLLVLSVC
jgi:hypothetical protein